LPLGLPGILQPPAKPVMVTQSVHETVANAGATAAVATTGTAHTPVRTTARLLGLFMN
jgi:hypothetical protein